STRCLSTTLGERFVQTSIDLEQLGLDGGGQLLIGRALAGLPAGSRVTVRGRHPALRVHLAAWCRVEGHGFQDDPDQPAVVKGTAQDSRWRGATRAGDPF